jgi:hypothetical protein
MKLFIHGRIVRSLVIIAIIFIGFPALARKLSEEQLARLRQGEIVREVKKEGGTQSGAWSVGYFKYKPELMWKVICSLELYDEYLARTTVSVLLDEETKNKVIKSGFEHADEVEALFKGMKPGYKKVHNDGRWTVYSYQRNSFPWPVSDRWVLLEITHDDKLMKQTWKRLCGNIKEDYGSWVVGPDASGGTLATNDIHIDLAIPATGPFTAFAMDVTLPETYRAFEKMAEGMLKNNHR